MNKEQQQAYDHAQVELAFARGERVEVCLYRRQNWMSCEAPLWNWHDIQYRVAPKPIECWAWVNGSDGACSYHPTKKQAEQYNRAYPGHAVLMREVV